MRSPLTLLALVAVSGIPFTFSLVGGTTTAGPAEELVVKAMDYAFEIPATTRPGRRVVRLVNTGREPHHVFILKLEQGKTMTDVFAALKHGGDFPAWAKQVGGPNAPLPGRESVAIVDLEEGSYVVMCVIPSPDGKPHVMKGMVKPLTVAGAPMPDPDLEPTVQAVLTDYAFTFGKPLAAGRQVIEFTNRASQPHEAFLARLMPGKKPEDLFSWMARPEGAPPVVPVGGITGIEPDATQSIVVDLEPGNYVWYCFLPDAKDGREHIAHGMVRQFTIAQPRQVSAQATPES